MGWIKGFNRINKSLALLLLPVILQLGGCSQSDLEGLDRFAIKTGDLLFQYLDCGELCEAIERVTSGYGGPGFSHMGIVAESKNGKAIVIEAVSEGVTVTDMDEFLARSSDQQGRPKIVVGRLKGPYKHLIDPAIHEGFSLRGKPYDRAFSVRNDAYYCSELIYEIFRRANKGKAVFKLAPMTFKDPQTGRILSAWRGYFSRLGISVPEGEPGINPGGISLSPLIKVYSYQQRQ